jgi:hypothetical protein
MIACPRPANFLRLARQIHVGVRSARNHQGRIPEGKPLLAIHHLWSKLHTQLAQWCHLLFGEPPLAAGDLKLRCEVSSQDDPIAAALAGRQFGNRRLPVANRKAGTQLLPRGALPRKLQDTVLNVGL